MNDAVAYFQISATNLSSRKTIMLVYIQRRSARPDGVGQERDVGEKGRSKSALPQDINFPRYLPFHRAIERKSLLHLYDWFGVGEGTLPLHHLFAQNTPTSNKNTQTQTANHN
jgi:hypothetical protein